MIVTLLRPVAGPWGSVPAGDSLDVPDEVAAVWVAHGVAAAPAKETTSQAPGPENAAQAPPKPRGRAPERRG